MLTRSLRAALALVAVLASVPARGEPISLGEKLLALATAYPNTVESIGNGHLTLQDGTRIPIDDGREKDHAARLADADIEDMLSQIYPIGRCRTDAPPARNFDPGRIRNEAFFRAVYGASADEVGKALVRVEVAGRPVGFSARAGAAEALERVAADLEAVSPEAKRHLEKPGGTFNWRRISGTDRLSVHSFGAAFDTNPQMADYWRWSGGKPGNVPNYSNRVPMEIVDAFERHGFVWGGAWYHYDTMHFEYRPEMIAIGRMAEERGCEGVGEPSH